MLMKPYALVSALALLCCASAGALAAAAVAPPAVHAPAPAALKCTGQGEPGWFVPALVAVPFDQQEVRLFVYEHLMASLSQPSLVCGTVNKRAYRFIWDPAFRPSIAVRAWQDAQGQTWIAAESGLLKSAGTIGLQRWKCPVSRRLEAGQWQQVEAAFMALERMPEPDPRHAGVDGESWWLESALNGRQRLLDRWQPRDTAVRHAGRLLVQLGGCDVGHALDGL